MSRSYGNLRIKNVDSNDCRFPYKGWIITFVDELYREYVWFTSSSEHPIDKFGKDFFRCSFSITRISGYFTIKNLRRVKNDR